MLYSVTQKKSLLRLCLIRMARERDTYQYSNLGLFLFCAVWGHTFYLLAARLCLCDSGFATSVVLVRSWVSHGLRPAGSWTAHSCSLPCQRDGEENQKGKSEKTHVLQQRWCNGESKSQAKQVQVRFPMLNNLLFLSPVCFLSPLLFLFCFVFCSLFHYIFYQSLLNERKKEEMGKRTTVQIVFFCSEVKTP